MKTEKNNDQDTRDQQTEKINKGNTNEEAKVIPLQPTDSATLGDKITVNDENEDILTPVKDDKQDY